MTKPKGRPSSFTKAMADRICTRMANGESLRQICRDDAMPAMSTVLKWANDRPAFAEQYARARAMLLEHWADETIEIADDGRNDWIEREEKGGPRMVLNDEHVRRSVLRVDTRKWHLSKLLPKKFGDKVSAELTGPNGGPVQQEVVVRIERWKPGAA